MIYNMITSTDNNKIKDVCRLVAKKKERNNRCLFVAEGEKQVFEAPKDRIESIFCTEVFAATHPDIATDGITEIVSDRVFAKMSDTDTPQGVMAVVKMCETKSEEIYETDSRIFRPSVRQDQGTGPDTSQYSAEAVSEDHTEKEEQPLIVFLEDIRDPGNLGTIVRSAEAAGAAGIVMSEGTVDIYNPKTVRSTMGSIYRVPFIYAEDFYGELENAKKRGLQIFAAHLDSSHSYYESDFTKACGILIGNEASGLSPRATEFADECLVIPMCGRVESLNAAMAATVIMFEARRQRMFR